MRELKARIPRILFGLGLGILALPITAVPANAQTYSFKTLHVFKNPSLGLLPAGPLLVDKSGKLYGVTAGGGNDPHNRVPGGAGVIFELRPDGAYRVLYSFCPQYPCIDGQSPNAGLVEDAAGNLYGTTSRGGAKGSGEIFELTPEGELTVLYSFCSAAACSDGGAPSAGLIRDPAGNLYGTTTFGGNHSGEPDHDYGGTVFVLSPGGQEMVLYRFCSLRKCADGEGPGGVLFRDATGNLYGTTPVGGAHPQRRALGDGTVFEVTPAGNETVLYSFCAAKKCSDGATPLGGLVMGATGNLYGTTFYGGANTLPGLRHQPNQAGEVFKIAPDGSETVLHSFCSAADCTDGLNPGTGLVIDSAGNLYGMTEAGGIDDGATSGYGTAFELTAGGEEVVLHAFRGNGAEEAEKGISPAGPLTMDASENLYGTTSGARSPGRTRPIGATVFELVKH